ncbi:polyprenyl synthetase family protein [Paenibacillus sp. NPDC058071]|uniref:polyprenyl synthetase family protein n=1 Tax=Paenibacillus sp. NPDC058071 TaxID=3346326 RepID=UPI0036DDB573
MNMALTDHADQWYRQAEQKAARYFATLDAQVKDKSYLTALTADFQLWKKNHLSPHPLLSLASRGKIRPESRHYRSYIRWLNETGGLDRYLDRSVSYIYMRDLGKALDGSNDHRRVAHIVSDVKRRLIRSVYANGKESPELLDLSVIYRWAQKKGVENATIWAIDKIKNVAARIPKEMNGEHAIRKLIKIMIGVVMHTEEEIAGLSLPKAERARRLDEAIRLGYCYGLTYPLIDDLLDSGILNEREQEHYSRMIRTALASGTAPVLGHWSGSHTELIRFVHAELRDAFDYMKSRQKPETLHAFFRQSYVFFHAQDVDRVKDLSNGSYSNEELYLPIILKSSSSRSIVRYVIGATEDEAFEQRTFYYGIYNQLADDFSDLFEDYASGSVTAYTYYYKYGKVRTDLINPFEMYWAVISHLIHSVYRSDDKAREVILDRAVNGLKRCKERFGAEKYLELMNIFASGIPSFNRLIQELARKADNVDFFDKLLRDQFITALRSDKEEQERFTQTFEQVQAQINRHLKIEEPDETPRMKTSLIDAANYSLESGGKRLRPVLSWVMGVQQYGLNAEAIVPLLRSLEYMHTASLIFDDLPTQDNASTRRGRPTLHRLHNSATAELTGLFLIQKAIEEQSSLKGFNANAVLALIRYSSQKAAEMSMGQAMDLQSKGEALTLEQLAQLCFYKTGIAFEASLVMPAILAQVKEEELALLRKFAYHAGIAFQIKDDLLDAEGDQRALGKPVGQDVENNSSTFVTILGAEGARQAMWDHYCEAMEALKKRPHSAVFLKQLLNYLINRDH